MLCPARAGDIPGIWYSCRAVYKGPTTILAGYDGPADKVVHNQILRIIWLKRIFAAATGERVARAAGGVPVSVLLPFVLCPRHPGAAFRLPLT